MAQAVGCMSLGVRARVNAPSCLPVPLQQAPAALRPSAAQLPASLPKFSSVFAAPSSRRSLVLSGMHARRLETVSALRSAQVKISGRHLEVTDAIKEYVQKKVENATAYYEELVKEVDVRLSVRTGGTGSHLQKTEITVYTKAGTVRAEEEAEVLYASIDVSTDKVSRKLRKIKEKREAQKGTRTKVRDIVDNSLVDDIIPASAKPSLPEEVVRAKYFHIPKLSTDEALEAMRMVDHDFYLFRNTETGTLNVLYERNHGGYGVIVPIEE